MEEITVSALRAQVALVPGGRDRDDRPIVLVNVPPEAQPTYKDTLANALRYLLSVFSERTLENGLTLIVDGVHSGWRVTRSSVRHSTEILSKELLASVIVLRPDAFWDKQRVDNCTKNQTDSQAVYIPVSRLNKYIDPSQLPEKFGGNYLYNHENWLQTRLKVEEFVKDAKDALQELEQLWHHLENNRYSVRLSEVENTLRSSADMSDSTRMLVQSVVDAGKELLLLIEQENRNRKLDSECDAMSTPQDILDTIEKIEKYLKSIGQKQVQIEEAWLEMERSFGDAKELSVLGDGVAKVTNWILGAAELMLNSQQKVGFDVVSAEDLRREHEALELQCWETYGQYAELLYKIDNFPASPEMSAQQKDLLSQRDFMNFVCRSFATRLERRRNVLITSLRFFRLVSEYFDNTSEVFETLVMGNKIDDFGSAGQNLRMLQESQLTLDAVERELVKEGEKLSDMLSMPVKDALGRDVAVDYEEDIVNIRDILDATTARKNIFTDSVELQKLTLEQVTHVVAYEKDAQQAVEWLDDLFKVMLTERRHVGCHVQEIQGQKDEHTAFQETAKGTYNFGCQLLNAALALRQSCKLSIDDNTALSLKLRQSWQRLQDACQEQMTRLRVSAVFHRTVDEHCNQIRDLRDAVSGMPQEDVAKKRARVRKFLVNRERLLVEVGRMVRLGRLLRTRLREPLYADHGMSDLDAKNSMSTNPDNATAVEAISERLAEVTSLAEQLDHALRGAQQDCALAPSSSPSIKKIFDGAVTTSSAEEWYSNPKPTRPDDLKSDEEFLTASEYTAQSRSESFHTASECGHLSPWWEFDKSGSDREDLHKERLVLGVGLPNLPNPKSVIKPSPEPPPGKIVHEVTETTHLKVQHSHTFGVQSFVLTSETVKDGKSVVTDIGRTTTQHTVLETKSLQEGAVGGLRKEVADGKETVIPVLLAEQEPVLDEDLLRRMKEVSSEDALSEDGNAWGKYYHQYITKQAMQGCF